MRVSEIKTKAALIEAQAKTLRLSADRMRPYEIMETFREIFRLAHEAEQELRTDR